MSEQAEIIFMQTRLIRLASEEWHMPMAKIIEIFRKFDIYDKDTRLWCNGPSYIADMYREEVSHCREKALG